MNDPHKVLLRPERLRYVPSRFSWCDQRLFRSGLTARCGSDALALYLFLLTVADSRGLSFYSDASLSRLLSRIDSVGSVVLARSASATPSFFARYGPRTGPRLAHSSACGSICFAITSLPTESVRLSLLDASTPPTSQRTGEVASMWRRSLAGPRALPMSSARPLPGPASSTPSSPPSPGSSTATTTPPWSWPKKVNPMEIQQLFRLGFLEDRTNVVFVGPVGLGKTHLAVALGQAACEAGHEVLFVPAVAMINDLVAAQSEHRLKKRLGKYARVELLILDEVGYLPIDKTGADLMFQVLAARYEKASTILTTNRAYKHWPEIFNNDATLTAALLDRLVHHVCTVVIEGRRYRTKDQITPP